MGREHTRLRLTSSQGRLEGENIILLRTMWLMDRGGRTGRRSRAWGQGGEWWLVLLSSQRRKGESMGMERQGWSLGTLKAVLEKDSQYSNIRTLA